MHTKLAVEIVTHEGVAYQGEVDGLVAPGVDGYLGLLPRHAPLIAELGIGRPPPAPSGRLGALRPRRGHPAHPRRGGRGDGRRGRGRRADRCGTRAPGGGARAGPPWRLAHRDRPPPRGDLPAARPLTVCASPVRAGRYLAQVFSPVLWLCDARGPAPRAFRGRSLPPPDESLQPPGRAAVAGWSVCRVRGGRESPFPCRRLVAADPLARQNPLRRGPL